MISGMYWHIVALPLTPTDISPAAGSSHSAMTCTSVPSTTGLLPSIPSPSPRANGRSPTRCTAPALSVRLPRLTCRLEQAVEQHAAAGGRRQVLTQRQPAHQRLQAVKLCLVAQRVQVQRTGGDTAALGRTAGSGRVQMAWRGQGTVRQHDRVR